ncbi:MAG: serine hydrolase [Acidobacteriota bacterium]|nr:MAG: serine hydrolase [Acidobacteriota bacterium]
MKRSYFRPVFLLLVIAATAVTAAAQDKAKQLDEMVQAYFNVGQFHGSALVAENGKVIFKKGYGMADYEWDIPIKPDTKFRLGSITKQFTATLILQLREEGKIDLDKKLADYLPYYRKDTGSKVTIHQLLNHTSGIPSYTGLPRFFEDVSRNAYGVEGFVKEFCSGDLEFEPGSKYSYNNSGYFLLGAIVEQITGKKYEEVLQERIFGPLGMNDSGYDHHSTIIKHRATGYNKTEDGYENSPYLDMSIPYAAGSVYSTVEDLYKWDRALDSEKVLKQESKDLMFKPGMSNYGYGFVISEMNIGDSGRKAKIIGHGGGINGFNTLITRLPESDSLVVLLGNVVGIQKLNDITEGAVAVLNGLPYKEPKRSVAEEMMKTYTKNGLQAAVSQYRELKRSKSGEYDFSETELNNLGYQLLAQSKTKDAIEIFKLNVEMFPEASNPYDSLGEAYLADGNKELAVENYRKSVELNPENENGKAAIKRIELGEATVAEDVLKSYIGRFQIAPNFVLTVTVENGRLMTQATGQPKVEVTPEDEDVFVLRSAGAKLTFQRDASGKVTGLTLNQGGRDIDAPKID